jgi:glycosyltransferase involved in cell wall biosynthesis
MRVAQVICTFPPYKGGMGNAVYHFSEELSHLGHDVTVFTPEYGGELAEGGGPGFGVERLKPLFSMGNSAVLPGLFLRLKDFDVVQLHYPFYGTVEIVLLEKLLRPSTRLFVFYHMDARATGIRGLMFKTASITVLPLVLRAAEAIQCSTYDYASHSYIGGYFAAHRDRFTEVPYGVDSTFFTPGRRTTNCDKNVLFVGALIKQGYFKGLDNLMRAFQKIRRSVGPCSLTVVGRGDMEDHYRGLARELGIDTVTRFVTEADDAALLECYRSCDVLVLPSLDTSEAFGIVLLEAMACAKPVIASNLPGVRAVFKNGRHGLLVEPGDLDDLAAKLLALLTDDERAQSLGTAGYELVRTRYTWASAAKRLDSIYQIVGPNRS